VIASKVLALGIGALCIYVNKAHVIRWTSYWYGGLVIWNLMVMLPAQGQIGAEGRYRCLAKHVSAPHEAWIAADPFKGGFRVLITGRTASSER
jgi:hypothetical protein